MYYIGQLTDNKVNSDVNRSMYYIGQLTDNT